MKLRYTAEVEITEYERITREALENMKKLEIDESSLVLQEDYQIESIFRASTEVVAEKPIRYSTAGVIGSVMKSLSGVRTWRESTSSGAAVEFCYAAGSINITKADGRFDGIKCQINGSQRHISNKRCNKLQSECRRQQCRNRHKQIS